MSPSNVRARWVIWLVSLLVLGVLAWLRLGSGTPVNTNILSLLPNSGNTEALATATDRSRSEFVHQILGLISGSNIDQTREAAVAARKAMLAKGLNADDTGTTFELARKVFQSHHFALLDPAQIKRLDQTGAAGLARDVAVSLASPAGLVNVFGADPGNYLTRYMQSLPRPYPNFLPDGPFLAASKDGKHYFLLRMIFDGDAFAQEGSALAAAAVLEAGEAVREVCTSCRFEATGAPLFADSARLEAKSETIWLTIVSTLLIMVLIAYIFRSLAPHVLAALQLVSSVVAASAAVIACFGSIHILTLVFGTTLLGIAIDYAFLYFAEYWFGTSPPSAVMAKIRSGLGVGLATGAVAFAFLALAGFPALTQIAVFSVAGLIEAALVVVLIFPITLTRAPAVVTHPAVRLPQRFIARCCRPTRWRWVLPALALALAIPGWLQLKTSDRVQDLQHLPTALMQTDQHIRTTLGRIPPPGFFLIEAPTLNKAIALEEQLFARVGQLLPGANGVGLSRFLPSVARQDASLAAWEQLHDAPDSLRAAFAEIGLPAALADHLTTQWKKAAKQPLTADELFAAVPDLRRFVIPMRSGVALMATVFSDTDIDPAILHQAAAGLSTVQFVEPLERIESTFRNIRVRASWLVVLGYVLVCALLVWRYGRREAVRMVWPPLLAIGITLGALGWLGVAINVFVVVALILILGLGRDYAIFLREIGAREQSPALAVTLSALTTLLSFGLLSFSRIPALHAFGLAALIGILASYLSAPLSLAPDSPDVSDTPESPESPESPDALDSPNALESLDALDSPGSPDLPDLPGSSGSRS